jgi:phage-related protein
MIWHWISAMLTQYKMVVNGMTDAVRFAMVVKAKVAKVLV